MNGWVVAPLGWRTDWEGPRTRMLWSRGLCPMASALLPASSNPNAPQKRDSFPQPEIPHPLPSPSSHFFPCVPPSHPSSRSLPSRKFSFPDACPPSSLVPEKILLSWKTVFSFHQGSSPRLPKAHSRPRAAVPPLERWHAYQQLACFKVPSPQCFVIGCCSNSGNKTPSIVSL